MREMFVSDLVREMLGPRRGVNGIRETLDRSPMAEFMTGILSPIMAGDVDPDPDFADRESTIPDAPIGQSTRGEEDNAAPDEGGVFTVQSPSLDPGKIPSTMGISFRVESGEKINLKICITWARYLSEQPHAISCNREERLTFGGRRRDSRRWTRQPRSVIVDDVMKIIKKPAYIDSDGNLSDSQNCAEISLHAYARPRGNGKYFVSMYIVNGIQVPCSCGHTPNDHDNADDGTHPCTECDECVTYKGRAGPEHHIFQPQIRVIAPTDHTKIIEGEDAKGVDDDELEFLYRNRRYRARGHLTSAVWKDVDPENPKGRPHNVDYQECADDIPFAWTDGELLDQQDRNSFTTPDVRTDYVPLYSIAAPELEWDDKKYGPAPELDAEELAKIWKPDELRKALLPLCDGYEKWIDEQKQNIVQAKRQLCDKLIGECETVLKRIKLGIDTVCDKTDPDAALAFCFANKAIDLQHKWARGQPFRHRPFQLAYILMCIESIVNKKSEYRNSCDLMWVPTGTGKTEAYLALAVFTMAYRRRLALSGEGESTGAGVSIITRYTLRLLTTQQFRRTLSVVTAAEFLRTHSLSNRSRIGWRPEAWPDDENFIWGSSQFSTGLWIGTGVAPNNLHNSQFDTGAIEYLQGNPGVSSYGKAEPAQVVECPCCRANLSITDNGLSGSADMHLVVMTDATNISNSVGNLAPRQFYGLNITRADSIQHTNSRYHTISLTIDHGQDNITSDEIDGMWRDVEQALDQAGTPVTLVPFRASRPGYFPRQYIHNNNPIIYDFEIFCPNPECPLHLDKDTGNNVQWFRGSPTGSIHNKSVDTHQSERALNKLQLTDGNALDDVQDAFQENSEYVADRIPIPALVIDEQVYKRIPTIVVSTADKFARPAFEARASSLFGNVNRYHKIHGYYNTDWLSGNGSDPENPSPRTGGTIQTVTPLGRPDLILQDELHLIDGPLGSMVGIYETAVDFLCSNENNPVKYIASTATIKKADEHVRSLFTRDLQTFPPHGLLANDRFFVSDEERHQLADDSAGRLYLGISAPGKGGLMPIIRTWARLAQTAWEHQADNIPNLPEKLDPFWTLTGYFNANRELAGALGTYSQDIRMRIQQLAEFSPHGERPMDDSRCHELSGRTSKAADLPKILQILDTNYPNNSCADSLFTTSMFGTGVDISRLGLMLINGEPKTTSSYIQSSGRVGRKSGGLIIALLRPSRPRDLSHYEYFVRHHRQLHRFVEPPTVYPFAAGVMKRALGPVGVFMLRHMNSGIPWMRRNTGAREMETHRNDNDVKMLEDIVGRRELQQPQTRRLHPNAPAMKRPDVVMAAKMDGWQGIASHETQLIYWEPFVRRNTAMRPVVLGDYTHQEIDPVTGRRVNVVYHNAPTSLRDMEPETDFQTS